MGEEFRTLLNCSVPSTSQWKKVTRVFKDYSTYEGYQYYIEDETLKQIKRFYPPQTNMAISSQKY